MALLHYIHIHGKEYGITLSALNCDHGIRGDASARDSAFVREWCAVRGIPLLFFKAGSPFKNENFARAWRLKCYLFATHPQPVVGWARPPFDDGTEISAFPDTQIWRGADAVATAHHMDDNAETVLFNLARGSALSGLTGITDALLDGGNLREIRPLICCSRGDIDGYIAQNAIPFVTDETNLTDGYTRNKIRHNVLPELEKAVPGATQAIYRFSRLAAEDEEYFSRQVKKLRVKSPPCGDGILFCDERVLFKRAAVEIFGEYGIKDYTSGHAERLYNLQFAETGKKFKFLGLTAYREEDRITIVNDAALPRVCGGVPFLTVLGNGACDCCGQFVAAYDERYAADIAEKAAECGAGIPEKLKTLKFDLDAIPDGAVVRTMEEGDKFTKFGGGTKSLGDYFTDAKIPVRLRKIIPLVAAGREILAVCGVEISDKIKITDATKREGRIICADYKNL